MKLKVRTILRLVNAAKQLDRIPSTSNPQYFKNKIAEMDDSTLRKITNALDEIRFASRDIEAVTLCGVDD